jgi:hypothetical protein
MGRLRRWWPLYRVITFAGMIPILLYCAITKCLSVAETCILVPLCVVLAWGSYSLLKNLSNSK